MPAITISVMVEIFREKRLISSTAQKAQAAMIRGRGYFFIFLTMLMPTFRISRLTPIRMP